jgi:hypothetical protein
MVKGDVDIAGEAARLAALIGEPMPHVTSQADLLEYADHVAGVISMRAFFDQDQIDDLRFKLDPDSWLLMVREGGERIQRRMRQQQGLRAVQQQNIERSLQRGADTRTRVLGEAERLSRLPERERAGVIARRVGLTSRQVRRILREQPPEYPCPFSQLLSAK